MTKDEIIKRLRASGITKGSKNYADYLIAKQMFENCSDYKEYENCIRIVCDYLKI